MKKCRRIHAHERNEGAEVQEFSAKLIGEQECSGQRDRADKQDAVARDAVLPFHDAEEGFGNCVIASHAVEQSRRRELRPHTGADIRHQQGDVHQVEEEEASNASSDVDVSGINIRKLRRGPNQLRGVDLDRRQNAGDQAHQYGGIQNVFLRILGFLRER